MPTILLVEDEKIIAKTEAKMLEKHGFEVITAHTADKALEAVKTKAVDLILMDIDLGPGQMEGTEAAQIILQDHELPIIFLTSHAEKEYVDKVKEITGYGYVLKDSGEFVLIESINMAFQLKHREEQLERTNRILRTLSACNQALVRSEDETELVEAICNAIVEKAGYTLAWVGYVEEDGGGAVVPIAQAGFEDGYLKQINIKVEEGPARRGPTATAVLTQKPSLETDIRHDPHSEPWRAEALGRGYRSSISLPLMEANTVLGVLNIYASQPDAFGGEEQQLLTELAGDLAYGITSMRAKNRAQQAEQDLRESEYLLSESQKIAHVGSWELDLINDRLTWSDEVYRIFGLEPQEFEATYEAFLDAVHPEDRAKVDEAYSGSLEQDSDRYEIEHRIIRKHNKEVRHVHEKCEHIRDDSGEIVRSIGMVQDITERKQAEQDLVEREENLRVTLDSIGDAVIATDIEGKVVRMNPVAEQLSGWSIERARGKCLEEVFTIINADTREPAENPVEKVIEKGRIVGLANHTILISREGSEYQIADSAAPIRHEDGTITGVVLVFRDVTEEYKSNRHIKESKEFLDGILYSIQDGISVLNPDFTIRYVNPVMEKWHAAKMPLVGKKCYAAYHGLTHMCAHCPSLRCMQTGKTEAEIVKEYTEDHSDESQVRWIELFSYPLKDADTGDITGIIEFVRDISERKQAEQALRESLEEKDFLMKELNHRVENNLKMISSLINLKDASLGDELDLSDISSQIDAIRIVHEKLYKTEKITHIDVREYFLDLLHTIFSSFTDRNVNVEEKIAPVVIRTRTAIPLGLIINEVATNAIKHGFTDREEARFFIEMRADEQKNQYVLTLSNTGKPFPQDISLESPATLGLQLISALVDQLDGTVELEREPTPVFTIRFPMEEQASPT